MTHHVKHKKSKASTVWMLMDQVKKVASKFGKGQSPLEYQELLWQIFQFSLPGIKFQNIRYPYVNSSSNI